jgi:phenylacetate-CoA ligase
MPSSRFDAFDQISKDELTNIQFTGLKSTITNAYSNLNYFKEKCQKIGLHFDDLKSIHDLSKFPFTTKEDFRSNYPFDMFAVPLNEIHRIHASSGTTGKSTIVGYTKNDLDTWSQLTCRSLKVGGAKKGDCIQISYGYGLFTGGFGTHDGAHKLGCTVIPVSGGQTERQVQLLVDLKPNIIAITPSYLLTIADEIERQNIDVKRDLSLKLAFVGAEPWTEAMRSEINFRLNLQAINYYGISEIIGPGVASEYLEDLDGPTIWEDHFYPEIIDPETGEVLPDGEFGELVITSLTKEATPVIRYRTKDLTRLLPGTAKTMRRIERFKGRSDDMLIIRGVNIFPSQVEEEILKIPALSAQYQIHVYKRRNLDELEVWVEPRVEAISTEVQNSKVALEENIKAWTGVRAKVVIRPPASIERSIGKAIRVIDQREK